MEAESPADQAPPKTDSPSPWLKPCVAAAYLGIALGTLRNWTSAKFVPYVKRGGIVRYNRDALDRWLLKAERPGRPRLPN